MTRLAPLMAATVLVAACSSATPAAAPPTASTDCPTTSSCSPDGVCPDKPDESRVVEIVIDENANAKPSCVRISKGKSAIVWVADKGVEKVDVRFKSTPGIKPGDPSCASAECFLGTASQGQAVGTFAYEICVVRADGTKAWCDPKLIINP